MKKPHKNQLVQELQINVDSLRPNFIAYTEAKLSETPYDPTLEQRCEPGKMNYIDPLGEYDITSI